MSPGADPDRSLHKPVEPHRTGRSVLLVVSGVVLLASLLPPVGTWALHYEFVEALQFSLLAVAVPALVVAGSPWGLIGLAVRPPVVLDADGNLVPGVGTLKPMDRLAMGRRRHPEALRSGWFAFLFLAGAVVWRIPPTVNALARHPWLVVVEAVTLVGLGIGLWLELVASPPLTPRLSRPHRVALAAIIMWVIWILAYLVGLSHASWYHAYPHHPGTGFSLSADQQLTTGVMWFVSGCAFVPVVYWNLIRWLQAEEDPDEEMHRLVRQERIRGRSVDGGSPVQ